MDTGSCTAMDMVSIFLLFYFPPLVCSLPHNFSLIFLFFSNLGTITKNKCLEVLADNAKNILYAKQLLFTNSYY